MILFYCKYRKLNKMKQKRISQINMRMQQFFPLNLILRRKREGEENAIVIDD